MIGAIIYKKTIIYHVEISSDSPRDQYRPQQYENSLGKLQAVTVKAPRKIIDVMGVLNQDAEQLSAAQKVC